MSDNQENKASKKENNWWLTLPGILTGLAAILTAIGGLITVLYQVDILPLPQPTPTPSTPPIPSPSLQPTSTPDPVPNC